MLKSCFECGIDKLRIRGYFSYVSGEPDSGDFLRHCRVDEILEVLTHYAGVEVEGSEGGEVSLDISFVFQDFELCVGYSSFAGVAVLVSEGLGVIVPSVSIVEGAPTGLVPFLGSVCEQSGDIRDFLVTGGVWVEFEIFYYLIPPDSEGGRGFSVELAGRGSLYSSDVDLPVFSLSSLPFLVGSHGHGHDSRHSFVVLAFFSVPSLFPCLSSFFFVVRFLVAAAGA